MDNLIDIKNVKIPAQRPYHVGNQYTQSNDDIFPIKRRFVNLLVNTITKPTSKLMLYSLTRARKMLSFVKRLYKLVSIDRRDVHALLDIAQALDHDFGDILKYREKILFPCQNDIMKLSRIVNNLRTISSSEHQKITEKRNLNRIVMINLLMSLVTGGVFFISTLQLIGVTTHAGGYFDLLAQSWLAKSAFMISIIVSMRSFKSRQIDLFDLTEKLRNISGTVEKIDEKFISIKKQLITNIILLKNKQGNTFIELNSYDFNNRFLRVKELIDSSKYKSTLFRKLKVIGAFELAT